MEKINPSTKAQGEKSTNLRCFDTCASFSTFGLLSSQQVSNGYTNITEHVSDSLAQHPVKQKVCCHITVFGTSTCSLCPAEYTNWHLCKIYIQGQLSPGLFVLKCTVVHCTMADAAMYLFDMLFLLFYLRLIILLDIVSMLRQTKPRNRSR